MFFSGLLAKWNENTFQSVSLKGMGWEEEGEQEAQRLQQSTDALFSSRQEWIPGSRGPFCTSHLGNSFSSFGRSQMPAAKCVQGGNSGERNRGGRSTANLAADQPCRWQQGGFSWSTPRRAGPVLVAVSLCSISQAGRHGTGSFAPGEPYLKFSSKKEMSQFAFS